MPYVVVDNFSGGLDSRRHVLNSKTGTLSVLKNAHVTRGGELEKRKAFVELTDLDASVLATTFGLEATSDGLYVFGSDPAPATMPSGFIYQRLQHPIYPADFDMTKVVFSTVYGGKPFVIAEFASYYYPDGHRIAFYDGVAIKDFYEGYSFTDENLVDVVNRLATYFTGKYSATTSSVSDVDLYITGPAGKSFTATAVAASNITATVTTTQVSKEAVDETLASGSFAITAGSEGSAKSTGELRFINGNALPDITGIYVNGVEITGLSGGSGIRWNTVANPSLADLGPRFAFTLWTYINANSSVSNIKADYAIKNLDGTDQGNIIIKAPPEQGAAANGWTIQIEFASNPSGVGGVTELANTFVVSPYDATRYIGNFSGGVMAGGVNNDITSVTVDGVEVMGSTQSWVSSNTQTMQNIATKINSYSSFPEYTASVSNGKVVLSPAAGTGAAPNGRVISVTTVGNVVASGLTAFSGGNNTTAGVPQITRIRYTTPGSLSVPPGSKFSVTIIDPDNPTVPLIYGASRVAGTNPSFSVTYKAKEYMADDSTLFFSAVNDATKWDIYDTGSGFIDMSNNFGGRESLTGVGVYQDKLAVFSRRNVQLWFMDADPAQNQQLQILANTGAVAPDSVVSVGSIDLMYLADNGVRSLRARESTDTAFANDIGSAIDSIIIDGMSALDADTIAPNYGVSKYTAKATIEPIDGRYWLALGGKIYVLSYFPGSNISAWSVYEPFTASNQYVTEMVAREDRVYVRDSNNKVYVYGGVNGSTYDDCEVVIELPYLDANKPATYKEAKGVDLTCNGEWKVYLGFDHTNPESRDLVATVTQSTFALGKIPATGAGTHFGPRFVHEADGPALLANFIVHYDEMHSKHDAG